MDAKNAIKEIKKLLGFSFSDDVKTEEFATVFLDDGSTQITNNKEGDLELGDIIYVVLEDGTLTPAPPGEHRTQDGFLIILDEESILTELREVEEEETEEVVEEVVEEEELSEEDEFDFAGEVQNLKDSIEKILNLISESNDEFKSEVKDIKTQFNEFKNAQSEKGITERKPINQTFSDYRVEFLKKHIK